MATTGPVSFHTIDHTADLGILVRAHSLAQLYERAAAAMFCLLADLRQVEAAEEESLSVAGEDRESLLVAWLAELLYRHEVHGRVYRRFEVTAVGPTSLSARVAGENLDPERHLPERELKAVTYHQLLVSEDRGSWSARVVFDL